MSAPTTPAQQPPIKLVREVCARGRSKVCSCTYAAKTSLPPCRAAVAIAVLEARVAKLEAALREIERGDRGAGYPHRDEGGRPTNTDVGGWGYITDNYDDCFDAGVAAGEWDAAQIARAALTPEPR